jgi:WD40 repeat protein
MLPATRRTILLRTTAAWFLAAAACLGPGPAAAQERLRAHALKGGLRSLCFSATGRGYAVAVAESDTTDLFDARTGEVRRRLDRGQGHDHALCYGPGDRLFASEIVDRDARGEDFSGVRVWDLTTGEKRLDLRGPNADAVSLAFAPDGNVLAAGYLAGDVRLWRLSDGRPLATLERGGELVTFARGGRELVTAGSGRRLLVWDASSFKLAARLGAKEENYLAVAPSPSGDEVYAADGGQAAVEVWDLPRRKRTARVELDWAPLAPPFDVMALAPAAGLVAAARGGTVAFWDVRTGKPVGGVKHARRYEVERLAFDPDGKVLLTGATDPITSETEVVLWRLPKRP